MPDALAILRKPFRERAGGGRLWTWVAHAGPRFLLAALFAAVPSAALLVAALAGPDAVLDAVTSTPAVRTTFSRFIAAVATASSIAATAATLALSRELRGIRAQERHHETNAGFRARVREAAGSVGVPVAIGPFLATALDLVGPAAARARAQPAAAALALDGLRLEDLLREVEARARAHAARVAASALPPNRLLSAALDFETDYTLALLHRFRRASDDAALQAALDEVVARIHDVEVGTRYLKTLAIQWGLSRMATVVLVTTIPAIFTAAAVTLAYGDGAVDALGPAGAAALLAAALAVATLPLACFVSYLLRFLFLNEHTLPTHGFVLGPELGEVAKGEAVRVGRSARTE